MMLLVFVVLVEVNSGDFIVVIKFVVFVRFLIVIGNLCSVFMGFV